MIKQTFLMAVAVAICGMAMAQTVEINNVKKARPAAFNYLKQNNVVQGYSTIYLLDQADRKTNVLGLSIYDNNLQEQHKIALTKTDRDFFVGSSFNGSAFCFNFFNTKDKEFVYNIYDLTGKPTGTYRVGDLSNAELLMFDAAMKSESETYGNNLVGLPGKGFLRYGYDKIKGMRASIEMFDTKGVKKWTETSGVSSADKSFETAFPFFANSEVVGSLFMTRESKFSMKDMKLFVAFADAATGKEKFRIPAKGKPGKYLYSPIGATYDEATSEYYIYGEYLPLGSNFAKDESTGIYIQSVSKAGVIVKETVTPWTEIRSKFPSQYKAEEEHLRKLTVHHIIRTADGNFCVIAEQYGKGVDAAAVAMNVLAAASGGSSGAGVVKMNIYDMVTLKLNSDRKLEEVMLTEKQKSGVSLSQGYQFLPSTMLAFMMKMDGYFDYSFTSVAPDRQTFNFNYINFDREKGEESNFVIGNVGYGKDKKLKSDPIRLPNKPTWFAVSPAKQGYISLVEYYKKDKKLVLRLERVNI